jgi:hypothetical protein
MIRPQRYVSDELCHFVGRGKSEEEQYEILVNKILKTGWITHGPHHDPTKARTASFDLSKPISTDEAIRYQVVCFCDIPIEDLTIHTSKYSRFGLAFDKKFLITRGACPVFYIANESPVPATKVFSPDDFLQRIKEATEKGAVDRALYFDTSFRAIVDLLVSLETVSSGGADAYVSGLSMSDCRSRLRSLLGLSDVQLNSLQKTLTGNQQFVSTIRMCQDFLFNYVFTYFKCFNAIRDLEDKENYYMEREWRIANNVQFTLRHVIRVFYPSRFDARFKADLPSYTGEVTFLDAEC